MTEDNYGKTFEEVPEEAKEHADKFMQCAFKDVQHMQLCRKYFDAILRNIYRKPGHSLIDYY